MVEQPHSGKGHGNIALVALFNDQIVPDGAAGLGNVADTGGAGTLDIVSKGEESVGAQAHAGEGVQKFPLFRLGQGLGTGREIVLPDAIGANVLFIAVDIAVNDIVPVRTAEIAAERQAQRLGVLPQEPGIRLGTGKPGAVDPRLLSRRIIQNLNQYYYNLNHFQHYHLH